jgi:hypothetical protein
MHTHPLYFVAGHLAAPHRKSSGENNPLSPTRAKSPVRVNLAASSSSAQAHRASVGSVGQKTLIFSKKELDGAQKVMFLETLLFRLSFYLSISSGVLVLNYLSNNSNSCVCLSIYLSNVRTVFARTRKMFILMKNFRVRYFSNLTVGAMSLFKFDGEI